MRRILKVYKHYIYVTKCRGFRFMQFNNSDYFKYEISFMFFAVRKMADTYYKDIKWINDICFAVKKAHESTNAKT
jgi:hypothetical protein